MTACRRLSILCIVWLLQAGVVFQPGVVLATDAILVRPSTWHASVAGWLEYRQSQGLEIQVLDAELGRDALQAAIAKAYAETPQRLRFILLAGDVGARTEVSVPTHYRTSRAMVQFGGDQVIATDNPYGDMDGDDIPELAIGRIPADTPKQLEQALARVMTYEQNQDYSAWRRDVHVIAGVGGFGALADSMIEMTTRQFLAERIPGWSELSMTQASLGSHYCPDPWRFSEACIDRFNDGGMFWIYIGHGHVRTLDSIRAQDSVLPIFNTRHVSAVNTTNQPPIAVFLACYTGAFDALEDSLAEELILREGGPIAAIAASRVSGPYGLAMLSDGLLQNYYQDQRPTLGEVCLFAKRKLLQSVVNEEATKPEDQPLDQMQMIQAIATALSPHDYDLRAERVEHIWQMHLLGDPMLRLSYPSAVDLEFPTEVLPGETIQVSGTSKVAGRLVVEFGFRREQVRRELNNLSGDLATREGRDQLQARYLAANQRTLASAEQDVNSGPFQVRIAIPSDVARGRYSMRAFIQGQDQWQVGYGEIRVARPKP